MKILNKIYEKYIKIKYNIGLIYENFINNFLSIDMSWDKVSNILYVIIFLIIIISSLGVLLSKNPIHSVFFLIIVFLNVSFLLLLLRVEFLAFLIFIVYLGAIAVLFLFVIMMFNIHILETRDNIIRYIPLILVILFIIMEMSYITDLIKITLGNLSFFDLYYLKKEWLNILNNKDNIVILSIIYTHFMYSFIIASVILLVAMIGAIILTLNTKKNLKKQIYKMQNNKNLYNSVALKRNNNKIKLNMWNRGVVEKKEQYYFSLDD